MNLAVYLLTMTVLSYGIVYGYLSLNKNLNKKSLIVASAKRFVPHTALIHQLGDIIHHVFAILGNIISLAVVLIALVAYIFTSPLWALVVVYLVHKRSKE